ncbi:MAG: hypothetical protein ACHQF0_00880 [Chitinophagales bacterium]
MSKLFAIAIPILPDKMEEWKSFVKDINGKWKSEFKVSRKKWELMNVVFISKRPWDILY